MRHCKRNIIKFPTGKIFCKSDNFYPNIHKLPKKKSINEMRDYFAGWFPKRENLSKYIDQQVAVFDFVLKPV